MTDLAVKQHSMQNGIALSQPYRANTTLTPVIHHSRCTVCLKLPLPSKYIFCSYPLMLAHHSLRSHSPLKSVLNKIGDSYQTYCNTYKTHTMATHHRGAGQPSDRDPNLPEQDTDTPSDHLEDIDNFENVKHENHTTLKALTRNLDDLWHRGENANGQPMEAIYHLEHELHRLSLTLQPSALPEPLDEVLQQCTETLCSAQKQPLLQTL